MYTYYEVNETKKYRQVRRVVSVRRSEANLRPFFFPIQFDKRVFSDILRLKYDEFALAPVV